MTRKLQRFLLLSFAVFYITSFAGCSNSGKQLEEQLHTESSALESTTNGLPAIPPIAQSNIEDNTTADNESTLESPTAETTEPICTHIYSDWIVDLSPTIRSTGQRHKDCTVCGQTLTTESTQYSLEPLPPCYGFITLQDHSGRYLSFSDNQIITETTPTEWNLMSCGNDRYYLKDTTGFYVMEYYYGTLKMEEDTGYTEQQWILKENEFGDIVIAHADAQDYYLRSDEVGNLSVVYRNNADEYCIWSMQDCGLIQGYPYAEITSQDSSILLRVEHRVFDIISHERLQKWANDLEQAYISYAELTGWKPFESVEIRGYTNCGSWGYVLADKPVVHVNKDELYKDLEKMSNRENDWNFGVLHELSHLFDKEDWAFEWEALAHYKVGYVLYKHDALAAPAEFPSSQVFSYTTMKDAFWELEGSLTNHNGAVDKPLAIKLWEITDVAGWQAVVSTFSNFPESGRYKSNVEKLDEFLLLVQKYSEKDVKSYFSTQEWTIITESLQ